jgi:hypothetical protein
MVGMEGLKIFFTSKLLAAVIVAETKFEAAALLF